MAVARFRDVLTPLRRPGFLALGGRTGPPLFALSPPASWCNLADVRITADWEPVVLDLYCRQCGRPLRVVQDSTPDRERTCSLCIISSISREEQAHA
jgi:hypothetical protein